jgi:hypothetical protein
MNFVRKFAAVAIACLLSACGGDGDQDQPAQQAQVSQSAPTAPVHQVTSPAVVTAPAPIAEKPVPTPAASEPAPVPVPYPVVTPPAPKPPKPILIEVYGDDAMMGLTSQMSVAQQSETVQSQALLQAQLNDTAITITNKAMGGTASTLVNMMRGVDGGGPPFAERIKASKAQIVLMNHAINDNLVQSLAPYTDAMIDWIKAVRDAGKIPVLEEPNPVCDGNHPWLENYVSVMDNTADAYKVPLVKQYANVQALPNWQSHMNACLYPDEWMLSIKAQRQAEVLAPIVARLLAPE